MRRAYGIRRLRPSERRLSQAAGANSATKADTAVTAAGTADPFEQRRRDYITKLWDWRDEKDGPLDIRNFPDKTGMALYTDAKRVTDDGRVGKGYGTLSDGANPTFSASLDKELGMERDLEASGRLEGFVNNSLKGADVEAGNWANAGNARNMNIAGIENGNYNSAQDRSVNYLMRPKQPSFLKQLALGMQQNANSAGQAAAMGGA